MKQVKWILLVGLFHQMVIYGSRPIIALLADELGASVLEIGLMAATFAVFPVFLAVRAGSRIDRWGYILPIVVGSLGVTIALVLPYLFPAIAALYLSQMFAGVSQVFVNISLQNGLGLIAPKEKRDHYFGWFSFAVSGGQFLGPVTLGFVSDRYDSMAAFLAGACLSLVPILVGLRLYRISRNDGMRNRPDGRHPADKPEENPVENETAGEAPRKWTMTEILRIRGMHQAILASMLAQFTKDVLLTYFPLYAVSRGLTETEIGVVLGLQGLSSMFIRMLQGSVTRRFPRRNVLLASLLTGGLCYGLITLFPHIGYLSLLAALSGLGLGLAQPLSTVMVINLSPAGQSGRVLGIRIAGNRVAQVVSPVLFGAVAQTAGLVFVFWTCSAILIAGAVYSTQSLQFFPAPFARIRDELHARRGKGMSRKG